MIAPLAVVVVEVIGGAQQGQPVAVAVAWVEELVGVWQAFAVDVDEASETDTQ